MTNNPAAVARPELSTEILNLIIDGDYKPGDRLPETELAERLGVSRSPVRVALRSLEKTGAVTIKSNRGARVTAYSRQDVDDIYQARAVLEPLVASLSMPHLSEEDVAALEDLASAIDAEIRESSQTKHIADLNNQFHRMLLSRCSNEYLKEAAYRLMIPLVVNRTFKQYSTSELQRSSRHHYEIIDAVKNNDSVWLRSILAAHIRFGSYSSLKPN